MQNLSQAASPAKNSTVVYTQPSTHAEQEYYSMHGEKLTRYKGIRKAARIVWFLLATVGLHAVLIDILDAVPYIQHVAWAVAAWLCWEAHGLLEVTSKTYWYDRNTDSDGDGNNRDAADSSILVPVLLTTFLILADFYGGKTFLEGNIKEASRFDRAKLDSLTEAKLAGETTAYEKIIADINARYSTAAANVTRPYDAQIRQWQNRDAISDNDRRWIATNVSKLLQQNAAAESKAIAKQADDLDKASDKLYEGQKKWKERLAAGLTKADSLDTAEDTRVEESKANAASTSWILSFFLAIIFCATLYCEVRINVRSGIRPIKDFTALHAHGSFWEKFFQYVIMDTWNRRSHQFAVWAHSLLNTGARTLHDFDGSVIEHNAHPDTLRSMSSQMPNPPQTYIDTLIPSPPTAIPTPPANNYNAIAAPVQLPIGINMSELESLAEHLLGTKIPDPPEPIPTPPTPPTRIEDPLSGKTTGSPAVDAAIVEAYNTYNHLLHTQDMAEVNRLLDNLKAQKIALETRGWSFDMADKKIKFHPIEGGNPTPPLPPSSTPIDLSNDTKQQQQTAVYCDTVPFTVTQQNDQKASSEQAVIDGWFTSVLTAIQREPSNFDNPNADKKTVGERLYKHLHEMCAGLEDGRVPSPKLCQKALHYINSTVWPALDTAGEMPVALTSRRGHITFTLNNILSEGMEAVAA